MDLEEIRRLIDLGEKKELAEFEVERAGVRVRMKYNRGAEVGSYFPTPPWSFSPPSAEVPTKASVALSPVTPEPEAEDKNLIIVNSPIVGTFYAAPDPNSAPFVKAGDQVKTGQVLCIVEAMKLMNEIESEVSGEIVKIYVQNAQPVEYGEALFAIRVS
jgi:acetyl-CoA carboxylase biotin carboxyl carrier protein